MMDITYLEKQQAIQNYYAFCVYASATVLGDTGISWYNKEYEYVDGVNLHKIINGETNVIGLKKIATILVILQKALKIEN